MTPDRKHPHVAVIGAGFSGLMTAVHLTALSADLRVTLIERRPVFGRGVAYDTRDPGHLLNVRLDNMSAFPDRPDDLADWVAARDQAPAPHDFIGRGLYGDYLAAIRDRAVAKADGRLTLTPAEALALDRTAEGWIVSTSDGPVAADAVVLALGNLEPGTPPGIDPALRASALYVENPWALNPRSMADARRILVIGTGLTMVDTVLSLRAPGRRFVALSRRGLVPRAHSVEVHPPSDDVFSGGPSQVLAQVRAASARQDWRAVFDRLRRVARDLWRGWTPVERSRFLRHLRPLWDVHRHRLAPTIAAQVEALRATGDLTIHAGRLTESHLTDTGAQVCWRPRGGQDAVCEGFDLVVNCTGPLSAVERSTRPLIRNLLAKGLIQPDPLGLGLAVDEAGRPLDVAGRPVPGLYAIGPLTRGAAWEITAVPDLRGAALDLARRVTADMTA